MVRHIVLFSWQLVRFWYFCKYVGVDRVLYLLARRAPQDVCTERECEHGRLCVVLVAACEISNMLQVQFVLCFNHTKSHEGHEDKREGQEGSDSTSPSEEGHEGHELSRLAARKWYRCLLATEMRYRGKCCKYIVVHRFF